MLTAPEPENIIEQTLSIFGVIPWKISALKASAGNLDLAELIPLRSNAAICFCIASTRSLTFWFDNSISREFQFCITPVIKIVDWEVQGGQKQQEPFGFFTFEHLGWSFKTERQLSQIIFLLLQLDTESEGNFLPCQSEANHFSKALLVCGGAWPQNDSIKIHQTLKTETKIA